MGDAPHKSAKRASKYFKTQYEDAFNDFLHEEDIAMRHMMEAHKVTAMVKAGGVSARKSGELCSGYFNITLANMLLLLSIKCTWYVMVITKSTLTRLSISMIMVQLRRLLITMKRI